MSPNCGPSPPSSVLQLAKVIEHVGDEQGVVAVAKAWFRADRYFPQRGALSSDQRCR